MTDPKGWPEYLPTKKTLVARGEAEGVQDIRRRFQRAMEEQFSAIVEQATGRRVRASHGNSVHRRRRHW